MKTIMSLALAATMAVAGLGVTAGTSDARPYRDRDRDNNFSFSLQFGNPYYAPRYYRPYYAPRAYYVPAPRRVYRSGTNAHVAWCYDRYRSYRAYDNTYQPYNGPRRECISPYYG
jgi:hypothetical protein